MSMHKCCVHKTCFDKITKIQKSYVQLRGHMTFVLFTLACTMTIIDKITKIQKSYVQLRGHMTFVLFTLACTMTIIDKNHNILQ